MPKSVVTIISMQTGKIRTTCMWLQKRWKKKERIKIWGATHKQRRETVRKRWCCNQNSLSWIHFKRKRVHVVFKRVMLLPSPEVVSRLITNSREWCCVEAFPSSVVSPENRGFVWRENKGLVWTSNQGFMNIRVLGESYKKGFGTILWERVLIGW